MSNHADNTKAYAEACNTLRHYSNASLAVRSASVVQGLAILLPWAYGFTQGQPQEFYAFALPGAGVIFTGLLFLFHLSYFRATEFFYDAAAKMEQKLFHEDFRPIATYDAYHKRRYRNTWFRLITLDAPFTLIGVFFVSALILDSAKFFWHVKAF
jgi:hypothetical protein